MARARRAGYIAGPGRYCGTSRLGTRRRRGRTTAGSAPPSASTSTAIMSVGCKTCWFPHPLVDTDVHSPKIRDGQKNPMEVCALWCPMAISQRSYAGGLELLRMGGESGARPQELRAVEAKYIDFQHGRLVFPPRRRR